eukprot:scaffold45649_cov55-Cyclotella_meneghiniana.AAC.3
MEKEKHQNIEVLCFGEVISANAICESFVSKIALKSACMFACSALPSFCWGWWVDPQGRWGSFRGLRKSKYELSICAPFCMVSSNLHTRMRSRTDKCQIQCIQNNDNLHAIPDVAKEL